jgi:hypothetical protein
MGNRKVFSFLRSFYDAAKMLPSKEDQADFLLAVCNYGLNEEAPTGLSDIAAAMFELAKPNLDTSLARAAAGRRGGLNGKQDESNEEAKAKQNESKSEANNKQIGSKHEAIKDKGDRIKDIPSISPLGSEESETEFDVFWREYPKKVGKGAAKKAFEKAIEKASIETLVTAVRRQKCGAQWTEDNGRYIPMPSTWLNQERWEDEDEFSFIPPSIFDAPQKTESHDPGWEDWEE